MTVFTYSQARQNFASLLDIAKKEGSVQVRRRDGTVYSISAVKRSKRSPFGIRGVKTRATTEDILAAVRESRQR
jgi:antitoxin (DNA-binding transcriptional repressor) of toxin-antitoxin stability system